MSHLHVTEDGFHRVAQKVDAVASELAATHDLNLISQHIAAGMTGCR